MRVGYLSERRGRDLSVVVVARVFSILAGAVELVLVLLSHCRIWCWYMENEMKRKILELKWITLDNKETWRIDGGLRRSFESGGQSV